MERNKIHCGDALDLIDELTVEPDLIIMSPPDLAETSYSFGDYRSFISQIYIKSMSKLSKNGVLASITTDRKMDGRIYGKHIDIINSVGLDPFQHKIWVKSFKANLFILNYAHILFFRKSKKNINNKLKEFYPDVWDISLDKVSGYKNKDSFPSELVRRIVLNFSQPNSLVLDPFIGTGKTAQICLEHDRDFIGFEISREICDLANGRLAAMNK